MTGVISRSQKANLILRAGAPKCNTGLPKVRSRAPAVLDRLVYQPPSVECVSVMSRGLSTPFSRMR